MTVDSKTISNYDLFGTSAEGKCFDCRWYWNSAICKYCGCGPDGDEDLRAGLIAEARRRREDLPALCPKIPRKSWWKTLMEIFK